jgi:hypothetical protein
VTWPIRVLDAVDRRYPWSHDDRYVPRVLRRVPPVDLAAVPADVAVGPVRRRHAAAARPAMSAPTAPATDTRAHVRRTAATVLPGASVRRRPFRRYTPVRTPPGR